LHPSSNSPDHNAKGTQSVVTALRRDRPTSYRLWARGFRSSFTPRPGVLFTCPSRYSSTIGHTGVFSLGGWSPQFHARFHESGVTQDRHYVRVCFRYRAVTVFGAPFQETSRHFSKRVRGSYNPGPTRRPVWALPLSLAATPGISFDFSSCRYLDVSVPSVCLPFGMTVLTDRRVAPFGHLGITACVPLPRAYRSLPRPSSPLCAQASPTCFRSLDSNILSSRARAI
jgi:hypothetical protein